MLHGAADALRHQIGLQWPLPAARNRRESLYQAAAALGDERLHQAYAQGMALSYHQSHRPRPVFN
jgi:hypothetical protein